MVTKTILKLHITVYRDVVRVLEELTEFCWNSLKTTVIFSKRLAKVNSFVATGIKCKKNVHEVQCLNNPCDTAQCPNIPDAICAPSSYGQYSAHFFNTSGDNITSSCSSI